MSEATGLKPEQNRIDRWNSVDDVAQFIREVDGSNSLGAAALAEKLVERFSINTRPPAQGVEPKFEWSEGSDGVWVCQIGNFRLRATSSVSSVNFKGASFHLEYRHKNLQEAQHAAQQAFLDIRQSIIGEGR